MKLVRHLRHLSISSRLLLLAAVSSLVSLMLASTAFLSRETENAQAAQIVRLQAQSRMLAFNSAAVVLFTDQTAAAELLNSLGREPDVVQAALYDSGGVALATYSPSGVDPQQTTPSVPGGLRISDQFGVEILESVEEGGERIGTLYLQASTERVDQQAAESRVMIARAGVLSLLVAMALSVLLQRPISGPILRMAELAGRITSENDYSMRVDEDGLDREVQTLAMAFNRMLAQVQLSKAELHAANDDLESRVQSRTADLAKAVDAAESANRAKSEFLANMSHEIRTPLNAILGFANILQRGGDDLTPSERGEYLDIVQTSGQHLLGLINDILDLSKIEAGQFEIECIDCQPHQLISEIISVMRVKAVEKQLTLDYTWSGPYTDTIQTDPLRFRQVILNLVGNALKFTHEGGVHVCARLELTGTPRLVVDVIDSGIGIPEHKRSVIFDAFSQADTSVTREFGGTGLGLTICRQFVQSMGGSLTVESEPGSGSTFTVEVTAGEIDPERLLDAPPRTDGITSSNEESAAEPVRLSGRVLVVDDGDTNRRLVRILLSRKGAIVEEAVNGQDALDRIAETDFDLVLMDMQMPVMDGYQAAQILRDQGITIPIIGLTAHAMSGDRDKCLEAGCTDYLKKPIDPVQLLNCLAKFPGCAVPYTDAEQGTPASLPMFLPVDMGDSPSKGFDVRPAQSPTFSGVAGNDAEVEGQQVSERIESTHPMDDADFRELVEDFFLSLESKTESLKDSVDSDNWQKQRELAHWLVGAAGSAGFPVLAEAAGNLGQAARHESRMDAIHSLHEIFRISQCLVIPVEHGPSGAY